MAAKRPMAVIPAVRSIHQKRTSLVNKLQAALRHHRTLADSVGTSALHYRKLVEQLAMDTCRSRMISSDNRELETIKTEDGCVLVLPLRRPDWIAEDCAAGCLDFRKGVAQEVPLHPAGTFA